MKPASFVFTCIACLASLVCLYTLAALPLAIGSYVLAAVCQRN